MRHIFILVAMLIAASAAAQSQNNNSETTSQSSSDEQTVMQLRRDFITAFLQGDAKTYDRILAEDYKGTMSSGVVSNKQGLIERVSSRSNVAIEVGDMSARIYGNTAVLDGNYKVKLEKTGADETHTSYFRFTDTYVKQQDKWQMVSSHTSKVPQWAIREMKDEELKPITFLNCEEESNLKSLNSNFPTLLKFKNETSQQIKVHWINFAGERNSEWPIEPGKSMDMTTFLTHPFVVINENGECLGIYQPTQEPAIAVIKEN